MTTTFTFPVPSNDDSGVSGSWSYMDDDVDLALTLSIYATEDITQDVIDSAVEWAVAQRAEGWFTPEHGGCYDQDTCGFFFDGYVIEQVWTSTYGIYDDGWAYFCTLPLDYEWQENLSHVIGQYGYVNLQYDDGDIDYWETWTDTFKEVVLLTTGEYVWDLNYYSELPLWQCGTPRIVDTDDYNYQKAYYYTWDLSYNYDEVSPYAWLNDMDKQSDYNYLWATGFGDYFCDPDSAVTDGDWFTSLRFYQYMVEEPRKGLPHDWQLPTYTARYHEDDLIPVAFYNTFDYYFGVIQLGGMMSNAIASGIALTSVLVAISV